MKKVILTSIIFMFALAVVASPASAAPGTGACVQSVKAGTIELLDSPYDTEDGNLGDAISDGFFGNEPNLLNTDTNDDLGPNEVPPGFSAGETVGSSSPGPSTIGGGFATWGSVKGNGGLGSIPALCP